MKIKIWTLCFPLILMCAGKLFASELIPLKDSSTQASFNILVIPVEFNNWRHDKAIGNDNPYFSPISVSEIHQLYNSSGTKYFSDVSRGLIQVTYHVFDQWINMGDMIRYAGSSTAPIDLLTGAIRAYESSRTGSWRPEADYDKTVVMHAGPSWADEWEEEWRGTGWNPDKHFIHPIASLAGSNGKAICLSAYNGIGVMAHELGHALFNLKDKNTSSRIPGYRYDIMGAGAWNGVDPGDPEKFQDNDRLKNTMPTFVTPWNRVNLGWEKQPEAFSKGNKTSKIRLAPVANTSLVTGNACRNLIAIVGKENNFYILENRNRQSWDLALPDWGILVWFINDAWRSDYDNDSGYSSGIWERVIDTHPLTTDATKDFKYYFIDHRTSSFKEFKDQQADIIFRPLGLFDAPLKKGETFMLTGTGIEVVVEELADSDGCAVISLKNVDKRLYDI